MVLFCNRMKTRTGLCVLALGLILIIMVVLIFFVPAPKAPAPVSNHTGLSYQEHLKVTPPPPRNLAGMFAGDRMTLRWDAPAPVTVPHDYGDTITLYKIYRGTTPDTVSSYASTKDLTFTDRDISGSTQYAYEVTAFFGGEVESAPSAEIVVRITP